MEAAVTFGVGHEAVALLVLLSAVVDIVAGGLGEVVVIHEIVARVVGRVNVDHLHLPQVVLTQQFQHFEVVALNVEVLRVVEIDAFLAAGAQRVGGRRVGKADGVALVGPGELVAFLGAFHDVLREFLPELVEVNRRFLQRFGFPFSSRRSVRQLGKSSPIRRMFSSTWLVVCIDSLSILCVVVYEVKYWQSSVKISYITI